MMMTGNGKTAPLVALALLAMLGISGAACRASAAQEKCPPQHNVNPVDKILEQLRRTTEKLESFQAQVEYVIIEPAFPSEALRKGILLYARFGKDSMLRVDFESLKQDQEKEQKYREDFVFDGTQLIQVDYPLKAVSIYPLIDPNKVEDANQAIDVFELVGKNFPIVGFSRVADLNREFEVSLVTSDHNEPSPFTRLHLKVRPGSVYKDDYTSMDFWIDEKSNLPARILAVSTEGDITEIKLLKPRVNGKIDRKVFDYKIPDGFSVKKTPLRKGKKANAGPSNQIR
jgi:outer membrane lipoprotein-sorting protein